MELQVQDIKVMDTNPPQVCVTYTNGGLKVMLKSEWDKQNS